MVLGLQAAQAIEDDREDEHGYERLENRPRDPEESLLVSNLEVAPHKNDQQLAGGEELSQVEPEPAA